MCLTFYLYHICGFSPVHSFSSVEFRAIRKERDIYGVATAHVNRTTIGVPAKSENKTVKFVNTVLCVKGTRGRAACTRDAGRAATPPSTSGPSPTPS